MTDRYAVVGNPIAHSKSPQIHALFAAQTEQDIAYTRILAPRDGFQRVVREFFSSGGHGLNITVPFKEEAWSLAHERGPLAERAGAVNTLSVLPDGRLRGDNTDGVGLVRDLTHNLGIVLRGAQVLILGAGGAVRGVLEPLLAEAPQRLVIANRTAERAEDLAKLFADLGPVVGGGFDLVEDRPFDLIINATAAGLQGAVPTVPSTVIGEGAWCYDLVYGDAPTAFVHWARTHGAGSAVDGLGMLVEQAAESFYLWRGVRPETATVIQTLRGSN